MTAARRIYIECNGSTDVARDRLSIEIKRDADMLEAAVRLATDTALASARHAARAVIIAATPAAQAPKVFSPEFQASVQVAAGRFYNWPLSDGCLLADATRSQLTRDIGMYRGQAAGCLRNARFLELVADKVQEGQQVREVFNEEQLNRLMRRVQRETAAGEAE